MLVLHLFLGDFCVACKYIIHQVKMDIDSADNEEQLQETDDSCGVDFTEVKTKYHNWINTGNKINFTFISRNIMT